MNWAEEMENKKVSQNALPRSPDTFEDVAVNSLGSTSEASTPIAAPTVGWVEAKHTSSRNRPSTNFPEDERFKEKEVQNDSDDDIPVIPDIEDLQDDISSPQKIKQPAILIDRSTYKELDEELSRVPISSSLQALLKADNINLTLLTKKMLPEKDIKEVLDEEWTMESLYSELIVSNSKKHI